jgi:ubiquinone/menaquinone biosynthesis C-methylase UbiE
MSGSEFRDVFNLLVSTTDEYSHLLPLLEGSVLPRLSRTGALLDVGAGPGLITSPLSKHFDHIGLVEPDPVYCLEAVQKVLSTGNLVTAYNGMWEAAQFGDQQFDLIICAHVLYFVAPENWDDFIQKMVPHIAPGGRMAIVLVAKGDNVTELICRTLGIEELGSHPFSIAAIERVQAQNYAYEVLPFEASLTTETAEKLLQVMALFPVMQYDKGSTTEQRLALIEEHFKGDGQYRLPYTVDAVIVEAPTV